MDNLNTKALEESLENLRQNSDSPRQLQILIQLGQVYQSKRQYQKALIYFKQALNLVKNQPNPNDKIVARVNMGCVYWEMSQLKKAMNFFQDAIPIAEGLGDNVGKMMLCAIMGVSYWRKGEWPMAIDWFEKASRGGLVDKIKTAQSIDPFKYEALKVVMERGIETLKNRIQIAQNQSDPARILLPSFSMIPLLFFTGQKKEIPSLLKTIIPLAQKLKNNNILDVIPVLKKVMEIG